MEERLSNYGFWKDGSKKVNNTVSNNIFYNNCQNGGWYKYFSNNPAFLNISKGLFGRIKVRGPENRQVFNFNNIIAHETDGRQIYEFWLWEVRVLKER